MIVVESRRQFQAEVIGVSWELRSEVVCGRRCVVGVLVGSWKSRECGFEMVSVVVGADDGDVRM